MDYMGLRMNIGNNFGGREDMVVCIKLMVIEMEKEDNFKFYFGVRVFLVLC